MEDNGLLQYYRDKYYAKKGFLDIDKIENFDSGLGRFRKTPNVERVLHEGKSFYIKSPRFKKEIDSEVLLSQVYRKVGFKSAIYLPVHDSKAKGFDKKLISNDVCEGNKGILADNFFEMLYKKHLFTRWLFPSDLSSRKIVDNHQTIKKYFNKNALEELVLMYPIDVASFNTDRSLRNFAFSTHRGVATGVLPFDNGVSFEQVGVFNITKDNLNGKSSWGGGREAHFTNCLGDAFSKTRPELIHELKTNESVAETVDIKEIAEKIGNVDIPKIAEDIKQTIGYKVDKDYIDLLDASFYNMAEELSK